MTGRFVPRLPIVVGLSGVLTLAIGGGAALAYWRTTGTGSGVASTGTAQAVTVQAVATGSPTVKLIPGASGDLLVQLSNPNTYSVTVTGISQNGSVSPVGGSGCTGANSGVTVPSLSGLTITVAAGTSVVTIPTGASMSLASASACQGLVFNVPVNVTVQR